MAAGPDFLICREAGRCEGLKALPGSSVVWDNRFLVRIPGEGRQQAGEYEIKSLGEAGWATVRHDLSHSRADSLPKAALFALPALYSRRDLVAVPHLGFYKEASIGDSDVRFIPAKSVTSAGFPVV